MRTTTLILSLTTVTFAGTTGWLAWELHERGAAEKVGTVHRTAAIAQKPQAPGGQPAAVSVARATAGAGPNPAAHIPGPDLDTRASGGKRNLSQDPSVMFARQFLARYDDSAQREVQLEEARAGVRRQYGRLKEQLGLSDEKFAQIVDVIAQQDLQAREHWARCAVDAACDPNNPGQRELDDRSQELLALLGPEHIEEFNRYRDALGERDAVAAFRGRLSDSQFLPQAQADQLIAALAQERERYVREVVQSGSRARGWGTNLGLIMYSEASSPEAQLVEAAQYSQRMRDRAAALLTPAQLAAYSQMQDELLAQLAMFLRPSPPPPRKADSLKLAQG